MTFHISGRGVEVSAVLRRRVGTKLAKVTRFLPKVTEARVVLSRERHRHLTEVTLQAKGRTLRAEADAGDFHSALDLALDTLERQVRRRKDRIRDRKPRPSRRSGSLAEPVAPDASGPEVSPVPPVEVRRISAKPMSVDEALEQMRLGRRDLLLFTNAGSRVVNVLRRRADGVIELVEPGT